MNPRTRSILLIGAGLTESICGAVEVFGKHETYGVVYILLGIAFAAAGLAKHKPT